MTKKDIITAICSVLGLIAINFFIGLVEVCIR